jgi:hypothetical protein
VADMILTRGRGYEVALSVAKSVYRGVALGVLQEYGSNSQSQCPYRVIVGKGNGGYGHWLNLDSYRT